MNDSNVDEQHLTSTNDTEIASLKVQEQQTEEFTDGLNEVLAHDKDEEIEKLHEENNALEEIVDGFKESRFEMEEELRNLKIENQTLKERNKELEKGSPHGAKSPRAEDAEEHLISQLKDELDSKDEIIEELTLKLQQLKSDKNLLNKQLEELVQGKKTKESVDVLSQMKTDRQINELQNDFKLQLRKKDKELKSLEKEIERGKNREEKIQKKVEALTEVYDTARNSQVQANEGYDALSKMLEEKMIVLDKLEDKNRRLQESLKEKTTQLDQSREQADKNDELETQLRNETETEIEEVSQAYENEKETQRRNHQKELDIKNNEIEKSEQDFKKTLEESEELQKRFETEIEFLKTENASLRSSLESRLKQGKNKNEEHERQDLENTILLESLELENETLNKKLVDLKEIYEVEKRGLETRLNKSSATLEEEVALLKRQKEIDSSRIQEISYELQSRSSELENYVQIYEGKEDALRTENQLLLAKNSSLQDAVSEKESKMLQIEDSLKNTSGECNVLKQRIKELDVRLETAILSKKQFIMNICGNMNVMREGLRHPQTVVQKETFGEWFHERTSTTYEWFHSLVNNSNAEK